MTLSNAQSGTKYKAFSVLFIFFYGYKKVSHFIFIWLSFRVHIHCTNVNVYNNNYVAIMFLSVTCKHCIKHFNIKIISELKLYKVFKFVFLLNEDTHPRRMWVQSLTMVFLPFELKFINY